MADTNEAAISNPTSSNHYVSCRFDWEIKNVAERLEKLATGSTLCSGVTGSGLLKWKIGLKKMPAATVQANDPTPKSPSSAAEICDIFVFLGKEVENGNREPVDASFSLEYLDFGPLNAYATFNTFTVASETNQFIEGKLLGCRVKSSELASWSASSGGSLMLRAVVSIKNTHKLAFELAEHAHKGRMKALVDDKSENKFSLVEIKVPLKVEPVKVRRNAKAHVPAYNSIKVWKSMLVEASPVFNTMLNECTDCIESKTGIIIVKDCSYEAMRQFVGYIEQGPALLRHSPLLVQLVTIADKYDVAHLYDLCVSLMLDSINGENVVKYYQTANVLKIKDLKQACVVAIRDMPWGAQMRISEMFWHESLREHGPDTTISLVTEVLALTNKDT